MDGGTGDRTACVCDYPTVLSVRISSLVSDYTSNTEANGFGGEGKEVRGTGWGTAIYRIRV